MRAHWRIWSVPAGSSQCTLNRSRARSCGRCSRAESFWSILRPFGLKVGQVPASRFAQRIRDLVADRPRLRLCMDALLTAREVLAKQLAALHGELLRVTKNDELCVRFMAIPGVGPVTALAFKTTIDRPDRFRRSSDVGAHLGLAPRQYQSGEVDRRGRIAKTGDGLTRRALFAAANVMLSRSTQWAALKNWGVAIAKRSSLKKAKVAVARKPISMARSST